MLNDMESPFTLTLTDSGLQMPVLRFRGEEALNQPYRFDIELISLGPAMTPGTLLQQPAFLHLSEHHGVHGRIDSASCEHRGAHRVGYRVVLVPSLQQLAQAQKRRVFVHLSVPQILQQLLEENALPVDSYRMEVIVGQYPQREFCIQYEESDLALLHRLCEEEGIHYHFEHGPDGHVVVFADDSLSLPQEPTLLPFSLDDEAPSPHIATLFQRHDAVPIAPQRHVRNRGQRHLREDAANQSVTGPTTTLSQLHRYAEQRSRRHLQRQRCEYRSIHGRSDCVDLLSGQLVQVAEHPINSFNEQWLITEMRHHGQQPSILEPTPSVYRYHNDFVALPWSTEFRPALKQPRPAIPGYHLARVLGTPGQPASLDDQGRINVSLWSVATVHADDGIWLPIALTNANGRIAANELPCAGSEVWVSFLDSDPDRPILCLGTQGELPQQQIPPTQDNPQLLDWLLYRN
ncbi:type VI secretion system tip protein VgrG [Pseudomonas sp. DTU12.3]|uniref:type VI secretion system Vgr family protein n=1 Tax=Pseudomonas sp. DTU12.3 TaxID=2073078 RepID=UPI001011F019|nr:type VI secretion system tip protein TssI/VgrG [Pseudomonas sp. DTU12.3]QAX84511.1 type VI secretion system tip protein VgrG [Pseudomonas sp. DTU12.3]